MQLAAAVPLAAEQGEQPAYRVVTRFQPAAQPGMPGPYPGRVVRVHCARSIDEKANAVNADAVRQMLASGMQELTGERRPADAWARFISPQDVVGIKVNCSGAPQICTRPEVVAGIVENLIAIG